MKTRFYSRLFLVTVVGIIVTAFGTVIFQLWVTDHLRAHPYVTPNQKNWLEVVHVMLWIVLAITLLAVLLFLGGLTYLYRIATETGDAVQELMNETPTTKTTTTTTRAPSTSARSTSKSR